MNREKTDLTSVAEIAESIDAVPLDETEQTLTLMTSGGAFCSEIRLERTLWSSECDEREETPEGGYVITIKEHVLRELERLAEEIGRGCG